MGTEIDEYKEISIILFRMVKKSSSRKFIGLKTKYLKQILEFLFSLNF